MVAPKQPKDQAGLMRMQGVRTLLYLIGFVLIYWWASAGLQIAPLEFASSHTWASMGDIVMRLGPYYRVDRCRDAQVAWGPEDPVAGYSDPEKVAAVCERGEVLYLYRPRYLKEQIAYVSQIWPPLVETFKMALLGAFFGALIAIPFSLLAAHNLVKWAPLYYIVRSFNNLIRTIPELVWAALLTGALGIGALPGVVALTIFSFGLIAKLLSESIEAIDPGPLEAMRACGANWVQQIRYGVMPQVLPQFLAYTLYVFEVDVRASAVLGFVGAGGIGMLLNENLTFLKYRNIGAIVVVLLFAVVLLDIIGTKIRERLV